MTGINESGGVTLANAPVSYGAFELTVGVDQNVPTGYSVIDEVCEAGYAGIDLGPVGYLGSNEELGLQLSQRDLGLAGAYLEFPFANDADLDVVLPELDAMLDVFDAVVPHVRGPLPRPTIADCGDDARTRVPGRGARDPDIGHESVDWERFALGLSRVVERCRQRGYEPTFHHETGTYVESPLEIETVLSISDVGLCLDTGHFLIGGGDPVAFLQKWASRINHVHIKDADLSLFEEIVQAEQPTSAIWTKEVFPVLGSGDLDVDGFLGGLRDIGYSGWLVVEQDIFPQTSHRFRRAAQDQRANRLFLSERGW